METTYDIGPYDKSRDRDAAMRIYHECGWIDRTSDKEKEQCDWALGVWHTVVGRINGEAECITLSDKCELRYLDANIPMAGVTGVTTSLVARKQRLASRCTATLIAEDAADGAMLTALGIFDQGYYDRLGYGTLNYQNWIRFAPRQLNVPLPKRPPIRLAPADWQEAHEARVNRRRPHGSVTFLDPTLIRWELHDQKHVFGLGFRDGPNGELSHHLWINPGGDREGGPFHIKWMVYDTGEQFMELMSLLKSFEEQVRTVEMQEPSGMQLQDLLTRPTEYNDRTRGGKHHTNISAGAHRQIRMLDVPGCLAHTHLPCKPLRFNLNLTDPIERYLDKDQPWRGCGGSYIVTLGEDSSAKRGSDPALPTLESSVNAFTRMWLGCRPATGLATTTDLTGPAELLDALDIALRLPMPDWDWTF